MDPNSQERRLSRALLAALAEVEKARTQPSEKSHAGLEPSQPVPKEGSGEPRGTPTAERAWLTPKQATRYLGFASVKALYQAIRRGHIPVHRVGRLLRLRREELDQLISGR
jgi:excisionase family DNA binding protein